ncbi:MAG: hypothetical protein KW788_00935 [Candidatus Doudnabacteria bacterium]|nr:hypothetical protein [Candidatus Doudnabacteria bacterium]
MSILDRLFDFFHRTEDTRATPVLEYVAPPREVTKYHLHDHEFEGLVDHYLADEYYIDVERAKLHLKDCKECTDVFCGFWNRMRRQKVA